jgi:hypothetical protein
MKTLDDLKPDHNNQVYFDNDLGKFYIIIWEEGYYDTPYRFYIEMGGIDKPKLNPNPVR